MPGRRFPRRLGGDRAGRRSRRSRGCGCRAWGRTWSGSWPLSRILFVLRRGPLAHRQLVSLGAAERSPARVACTRSEAKGRSVSGGRRREAILYREEFGPPLHEKLFLALFPWGPKGKIVERSRCWPTGLGLSRA